MSESQRVEQAAQAIAEAIGRKDVGALGGMLAPDFVYRTSGEDPRDARMFLDSIDRIPGEIVFIRLEQLTVDVEGGGAVVTGVQHARVRVGGKDVDDRRPFVDWFVRHDGGWRIRLAIDLPSA